MIFVFRVNATTKLGNLILNIKKKTEERCRGRAQNAKRFPKNLNSFYLEMLITRRKDTKGYICV